MTRPDERDDLRPRGNPSGSGPGAKRVDRGGRIALVLGLSGVVLSVFFFPLGFVLDLAAIVVGVRALRRARQRQDANRTAPGAIPGIVFGSIGAFLVTIVVAILAIFWTEVRAYQECISGANTIESRETCMAQFQNAIEERFGVDTP